MFELDENRLFAYAESYLPMKMIPHHWQLFANQQTDLLLLPPFNRDLAIIQEWCNHWCIILNPNQTKALVVSRSKTVSLNHGDSVLSVVLSELVQASTSSA